MFSSPDPQLGSTAHRHSSKLLHTKALLASPLMKCRPISPGFRGHIGLGNRVCPSALLLHITYLQANTTFQLCFLFSGPSNPLFPSAVTYGNSLGLSASMSTTPPSQCQFISNDELYPTNQITHENVKLVPT